MGAGPLLLFGAAYLAALILPGPGVTALVARVLARGGRGSAAYIAGVVCGSLAWFTIAATGLAVLASSFAALFTAVRIGGALYLLYLAWRLWTAPAGGTAAAPAGPEGGLRLFLTGLAINLGNPKVIVFFLALLPTVVDVGALTPLGIAELGALTALLCGAVLTGYALLAARARRMFTAPGAVRLVNRGSAVIMAGTAVTIATR